MSCHCYLQPQGIGALLLNRPPRGLHVQLHFTAQKVVGVEAAQYQVGVGDGGLAAALAVGYRPWVSARALWPHSQYAT